MIRSSHRDSANLRYPPKIATEADDRAPAPVGAMGARSALEDDAANLKRAAAVSGTVLDVLAVVLIANEPKHGAERQNRGRKREHLLRIRD